MGIQDFRIDAWAFPLASFRVAAYSSWAGATAEGVAPCRIARRTRMSG